MELTLKKKYMSRYLLIQPIKECFSKSIASCRREACVGAHGGNLHDILYLARMEIGSFHSDSLDLDGLGRHGMGTS